VHQEDKHENIKKFEVGKVKVTLRFAEKPDNDAADDVIQMLTNAYIEQRYAAG